MQYLFVKGKKTPSNLRAETCSFNLQKMVNPKFTKTIKTDGIHVLLQY